MGKKYLLCIAALISCFPSILGISVICYHGTWSHYRTGNGKFAISDTPAHLCTHYIYSFVGLDSSTNEIKSLDSWLDFNYKGIANAVALKRINPDLKVLIAVGGWNEGSYKFSVMAADATKRRTFINSALNWLQTHGLDGLDLDWEYPGRRDSANPADKENFSLLIKELYEVFNPLGLIVTAAVSAVSIDSSYNVPELSKYLEFINLMLYDFHGYWDTNAFHNAPLYSTTKLVGTEYQDYSVNGSVSDWLSRGAAPSKLALGVPFYGRTVILSSASENTPGSPTICEAGPIGPYTATPGSWGYNEILEKFDEDDWTTAWDNEQKVPYAYSGTTWLTYENEESLILKVDYAKSLGLGAIMIWSIETGNFHGGYSLLTAINEAILGPSDSSSSRLPNTSISAETSISTPTTNTITSKATSVATSSTADAPATTTIISSSFSDKISDENSCTSAGFVGSSKDCSIYFYCSSVHGAYIGARFSCSSGLVYDAKLGVCNYPSVVEC